MPENAPRLALLTPYGIDDAQAEHAITALNAACASEDVAAVILRLARSDERSLVQLVKRIAPPVQAHGAAVVICIPGFEGDLVGVAARGGADGVHVDKADEAALSELRSRLRDGRILGCGGLLESRHAAMAAGETQADYLMFGGLYPDGVAPDHVLVRERATWWAEIFETPCIAVAAEFGEVGSLATTGAEFIGIEGALWFDQPEALSSVRTSLAVAGAAQ